MVTGRMRTDASLAVPSFENPDRDTRVIRSHRRPTEHNHRRTVILVLVAAVSLTSLGNSVAAGAPENPASVATEALETPGLGDTDPLPVEVVPEALEPILPRDRVRAARKLERKARPRPKPLVEIAISYALAQKGDPYRWAKAGPNSFDCSGLVLASFKRIGIKLPHYTGSMINYGKRVKRADMRRGDIIFPSSGHVGIYLGKGMMVHASSGKGKVVVAKVYAFYAARRLT